MNEEKDALLMRVMEQLGDQVMRLCYTYVRDWQTAEDLAQETFLRFYRASHTFRGESAVETFIYRIAVNVCHEYVTSWKFKKVQISNVFQQFLYSKDNVEQEFVTKTEQEQVIARIEQLPVKDKDVILLFYYAELSLQEIADSLKLPINTVKTRLRRARQKLRVTLEEGDDQYDEA